MAKVAGEKPVKHYKELAFMGFLEVAMNLRTILKNIKLCKEDVKNYKTEVGDTADNIPGVKGVGAKTAQNLIEQFGTLENIYENIENIDKKRTKELLIEGKENAFLSKQLVTLSKVCHIIDNLDAIVTGKQIGRAHV